MEKLGLAVMLLWAASAAFWILYGIVLILKALIYLKNSVIRIAKGWHTGWPL